MIGYSIVVIMIGVILFFWKDYMEPSQEFEGIASGNGRIETTQVDITAKYGGRVTDIYVQEGDIVKKGQLLVKVDAKELAAQLKVALSGIEQARQNTNYAQAIVSQRESELKLKEKNFLRSKFLYKSKSIPLINFEQDETAFQTAKAALSASKAQVTNFEASVNAAKAQVEAIEVRLDENKLYAPVSGRVLYRLIEPGEMVGSGGKVLSVLRLTDTFMTIFLPTSQVGLIDIGSEARIVLDAGPNVSIPAKVSFISPEAQFTPKEIETASEREKLMFRVKVKIDATLLKKHIEKIKTGLPGMAYVRMDNTQPWPEALNRLPKGYIRDIKP
mgnify:CR=1 FL=1